MVNWKFWKTKGTKPSRPERPHLPISAPSIVKYDAKGAKEVQFQHHVAALANEQSLGYWEKTGDAVSRYDRQTLVNLARQMDDDNVIYSTMLDRLCENLLGPNGFTLQAHRQRVPESVH